MTAYRVAQKRDEKTDRVVGWYVECAGDDGRTEIVTPLYLKNWEAQAEAERLRARDDGLHVRFSNRGL